MKLPAGTYFIGDPCYCFDDHDRWMRLLDATDYLGRGEVEEFEGHKLYAAGTAWGDGLYEDQYGNRYGVDAGMIGAVPKALWEADEAKLGLAELGLIVTFDEEFEVSGGREHSQGVINIGRFAIDTDPSYEDDDVEEEEDVEEDENA